MDYRKEENGDLVISAATMEEQAFIDAIIAAIIAYRATLAEDDVATD
jgi:hypothetical protein